MDDIKQYVTIARKLSTGVRFREAFELYILAFDEYPQMKNVYEIEFKETLRNLNQTLILSGNIEPIFKNFALALSAFPNNIDLLNDVGKYLYKYGYCTEAWDKFEEALKLDFRYVNAEQNLNSIKNYFVERWHFRMLNDHVRNNAYHSAISMTINPQKDTIIDVGTGTGLLALYAAEVGPVNVMGCDSSTTMANLAKKISEENGEYKITIVNKMSTLLTDEDIGGKKSILLTEMFDAGLFGEHALQMLSHAWKYLLSDDCRVVPSKAEFFVAGVNCDSLNKKYQLSSFSKNMLNFSGHSVHIHLYEETYDCEDVHLFKDVKYITEPKSIIKVDFNNYNDILVKLGRNEPYEIDFEAKEQGEVNVMIGWFNLYLTDDIMITTDPRSEDRANAWQQAVFFDQIPQTVVKNDVLHQSFLLNSGKLTMISNNDTEVIRISTETLIFLNDVEYMQKIGSCVGIASVYLGQITELSQVDILDLCPFPYFGLLMMQRGAHSLVCYAKSEGDEIFLKKVFERNNVSLSQVTILSSDWGYETFKNDKYHAIFSHVFEICGDIDVRLTGVTENLINAHLVPGGLFLPHSIEIVAQLVECPWIDINNYVCDDNLGGYKMSRHVNKYQASQNFYINFHNLEYKPLSEPKKIGRLFNGMTYGSKTVKIINNGQCNAILCWYDIGVMGGINAISTNRQNSFIDGTVFVLNPKETLSNSDIVQILHCVDPDGSFKLKLHLGD